MENHSGSLYLLFWQEESLLVFEWDTLSLSGWKEQPNPQLIEQAVDTVMENHSGSLYLLFWQEESLLVFEWDTLSLSLYHPSQQLLNLAQHGKPLRFTVPAVLAGGIAAGL